MARKMIGMLASFVLVLSACATVEGAPQAQGESALTLTPTNVAATTAPAQQADDSEASEGIKVHGHWTIEVRNPDGSLDDYLEFENQLINNELLVELLASDRSAGAWTIALAAGFQQGSLCPSRTSGDCIIDPVTVVPVDIDGLGGAEVLRLQGDGAIEADGSIRSVQTRLGSCSGNIDPSFCAQDSSFPFTHRNLAVDDELPVSSGQTVYVTVDISFG